MASKKTAKRSKTTTSKTATKTKRATKKATTKKAAATGTRKALVMDLLNRANGVTLAELMSATGWQAHSVRGFICILGKSMKIASSKVDGERRYSAA